ncbi:MAG: hypothetical protein ACJA2W_001661 [Planctomycetota bacterium]|jgi:hypothetical protein
MLKRSTSLGLIRAWLLAALALFLTAGSVRAQVSISGVPEDAPFKVRATVDRARLVIDFSFERGWHAYARDVGGGDPVRLRMTAADVPSILGELRFPETLKGELDGNRRLVQHLQLDEGQTDVNVTLSLTVCDALECLPPMELTLVGKVEPLSVLVVVVTKDDRAERIKAFLTEEGFAPKVVAYKDVTTQTCDAHDVVVADSKLFGQGERVDIRKFPETKSPIVAIGFLGTDLIEAHGLAMTSGYI